jgi:general secretion pathway protein G
MVPRTRNGRRGFTLVELIVTFTIMITLAAMSVPLARSKVRVTKERDLIAALREMHAAIDKYKDFADLGYLGPVKQGTNGWPETLDILVEGVKLPGPEGKKMRFLRKVPTDPFTGKAEWGMRSDQDDPTSTSWGGQNVFDVYTKSPAKDPDGKPYADW